MRTATRIRRGLSHHDIPRKRSVPMTRARSLRGLAAAAVATAAVCGLGAPAASAATSESIATHRGSVAFHGDGEELWAIDQKRDGYGIRAFLSWKGHWASVSDRGARGVAELRDLSIPERTPVYLQMCYLGAGGKQVKCSRPQVAFA